MDKTQQRIKIAETCGYVFEELRVRTPYKTIFSRRHNNGDGTYTDTTCDYLPDYLNDLNAMHEAEKVLDEKQLYCYGNKLDDLTRIEEVMEMSDVSGPEAGMYPVSIRATAEQRAEAFLRTLGLWEAHNG